MVFCISVYPYSYLYFCSFLTKIRANGFSDLEFDLAMILVGILTYSFPLWLCTHRGAGPSSQGKPPCDRLNQRKTYDFVQLFRLLNTKNRLAGLDERR